MKLNTDQAAKFTGLKRKTLENVRSRGDGPPYYKLGSRVVYDIEDLNTWMAAKRRLSTSDRSAIT